MKVGNTPYILNAWTQAPGEYMNLIGEQIQPAGPPDEFILTNEAFWGTSYDDVYRQVIVAVAGRIPQGANLNDIKFSIQPVGEKGPHVGNF